MKRVFPLAILVLCYGVIGQAQKSSKSTDRLSPTTFANLGTPANGAAFYCSDCAATAPCTGPGTGANAYRVAGAWNCNTGAAGGTPGGSPGQVQFNDTTFGGASGILYDKTNKSIAFGDAVPSAVNRLNIAYTQTDDGGDGAFLQFSQFTANPSADGMGFGGQFMQTLSDPSNNKNIGDLRGGAFAAYHQGAGVLTKGRGFHADFTNNGPGTVNLSYGLEVETAANLDVGIITHAAGVFVYGPQNSGGGSVVENIGVEISDQSSVGSSKAYNLWSQGATSLNLFDGLIRNSSLTASQAVFTDASKNLVSVATTGTGNAVLASSPSLTTPNLGTPSAINLTNATAVPACATCVTSAASLTSTAIMTGAGSQGSQTPNGSATLDASGKLVAPTIAGSTNVLVGSPTVPSANNTAVLVFSNNTSKPTLAASTSALYQKAGEQYVQDSAGNETLISPHAPDGEWVFKSSNDKTGHALYIRTERLLKVLADRCGKPCEGLIEESGSYTLNQPYQWRRSSVFFATAPVLVADMGGTKVITPTPGATVTLTIDATVKHTIASWTSGEAESVVISGTPADGNVLTLVVLNDGVLPRVITSSTGLSGLGVVTGVASKRSTISFIALSGVFYETSRTVGF